MLPKDHTQPPGFALPRIGVVKASVLGFGALAVASFTYILIGDSGISDLFHSNGWRGMWDFASRLAGRGAPGTPALLDGGAWAHGGTLALETLAMSILAITVAGAAALLTFVPAASNVAFGELSSGSAVVRRTVFYGLRGVFIFTRAVPELVWALLIVFVFQPGILAGALALAIHNFGILGRLSAEVVENIDSRPVRALRAAGASNTQMMAYGIIPQALPQLFTYLLYRWEVVIRTTVIVGFVAAGGLGHEFRLNMSFFKYDDVGLLIVWYLILVLGVDLVSAGLRRLTR